MTKQQKIWEVPEFYKLDQLIALLSPDSQDHYNNGAVKISINTKQGDTWGYRRGQAPREITSISVYCHEMDYAIFRRGVKVDKDGNINVDKVDAKIAEVYIHHQAVEKRRKMIAEQDGIISKLKQDNLKALSDSEHADDKRFSICRKTGKIIFTVSFNSIKEVNEFFDVPEDENANQPYYG